MVGLLHGEHEYPGNHHGYHLACVCAKGKSMVETVESENMKNGPVPIIIEELPVPTRTLSSPLSEERSIPFYRKKQRSRRGGGRRWRSHKRAFTRRFNPTYQHHCGYSGILWASGKKTTKENVQELRNQVASLVYEAVVNDQVFGGVRAREYVAREEMSLNAYLADVRDSQWASYMEMVLAAKIEKASVMLNMQKGDYQSLCPRPRYVISLRNKHYTVYKLHSWYGPNRPVQKSSLKVGRCPTRKEAVRAHMRGGYSERCTDIERGIGESYVKAFEDVDVYDENGDLKADYGTNFEEVFEGAYLDEKHEDLKSGYWTLQYMANVETEKNWGQGEYGDSENYGSSSEDAYVLDESERPEDFNGRWPIQPWVWKRRPR